MSGEQIAAAKYRAALAKARARAPLAQQCSDTEPHGPHEWLRSMAFRRDCLGVASVSVPLPDHKEN